MNTVYGISMLPNGSVFKTAALKSTALSTVADFY